MSDGESASQIAELRLAKDVSHQPHGLMSVQCHAIGGYNPRRLLSPMLQRVQAEIGELLRFWVGVNCHHPALFPEFIRPYHSAPQGCLQASATINPPPPARPRSLTPFRELPRKYPAELPAKPIPLT